MVGFQVPSAGRFWVPGDSRSSRFMNVRRIAIEDRIRVVVLTNDFQCIAVQNHYRPQSRYHLGKAIDSGQPRGSMFIDLATCSTCRCHKILSQCLSALAVEYKERPGAS